MEEAVRMALGFGRVHVDSVKLCLSRLTTRGDGAPAPLEIDASRSWAHVGEQPIYLSAYNALLPRVAELPTNVAT